MSGRSTVKSAFENLRPTILREPTRSRVSPEAEARLLDTAPNVPGATTELASTTLKPIVATAAEIAPEAPLTSKFDGSPLLQKKKRERLLLVSFRMPQSLKEKLEYAAKTHEINQTDLINEAIELNLQRYV